MCAGEQKSDILGITREEEENMLCIVTRQVKLGCVWWYNSGFSLHVYVAAEQTFTLLGCCLLICFTDLHLQKILF